MACKIRYSRRQRKGVGGLIGGGIGVAISAPLGIPPSVGFSLGSSAGNLIEGRINKDDEVPAEVKVAYSKPVFQSAYVGDRSNYFFATGGPIGGHFFARLKSRIRNTSAPEGFNPTQIEGGRNFSKPTPIPEPPREVLLNQREQELAPVIQKYFPGDLTQQAFEVLRGENRQLNPIALNRNRNGSIDYSLWQINDATFRDMKKRYSDQLKKHGISTYQDLKDPEKSTALAKLIYDDRAKWDDRGGWAAWYGAPEHLR